MNCGLLGRKLGHSYSPQIHAHLGNYLYTLYEVEPDNLSAFMENCPLTGFNVTMPYKKAVIPFCSALTPDAKKLGSVNTIIRQPDGTFLGHNTDYFGFHSTVQKTGLSISGKKALVLGSGGASVTAATVLNNLGASVVTISRSGENNYSNLSLHSDATLIVNATPVGMYPNTGNSPVDLDIFPQLEGVIDLIYNPAHTTLLQQAERRSIVAENGLWMLIAQAKESAELFTGCEIKNEIISEIYSKLAQNVQNIILIGMPGCGKSTIGQILSKMTGREFIDADQYLERTIGITIPEIFSKYGENRFRQYETEILADLGKRSGIIIATGGGCVTRKENYPLLHQNGKLFWIKRDVNALATEGRPLSKVGNLYEMLRLREPMYDAFSDYSVDNNENATHTAQCIMMQMEA